MSPEILDFLRSERVCVIAVEMLDSSPHAATVHFATTADPLVFTFETDRSYRKSESLLSNELTRASLSVGFDEGNNSKTFQADGVARILKPEDSALKESYLDKFPDKRTKVEESNVIFFRFQPTWWRFTDYTQPQGKTVVTSDDK